MASVVISLLVVGHLAIAADGQPSNIAENLHGIADLVRAEGEFQKLLAESNLINAQAHLKEAEAQHEMVRVRQLTLLVNRLQIQLRDTLKAQRAGEAKLKRIETSIKVVSNLNVGRTSNYIFQNLEFLLQQGIPTSVVIQAMGTEIGSFRSDEFVFNSDHHGKEDFIQDFNGSNVGQLIQFMKKNRYQFVAFGPAHLKVLETLDLVGVSAREKADAMQAKVEELRNKVFNPIIDQPSPVAPIPAVPVPVPQPRS